MPGLSCSCDRADLPSAEALSCSALNFDWQLKGVQCMAAGRRNECFAMLLVLLFVNVSLDSRLDTVAYKDLAMLEVFQPVATLCVAIGLTGVN